MEEDKTPPREVFWPYPKKWGKSKGGKANLLEDGFEFRVPSRKHVYGVLIVTLIATVVCVIASLITELNYDVPHRHRLQPMSSLAWVYLLVAVPCWGIVWLLLAAPSRSHSKGYYIRYRLAQMFAMSAYGSALFVGVMMTMCYPTAQFGNLLLWGGLIGIGMVWPYILIYIVYVPSILSCSKKVRAFEIDGNNGHYPVDRGMWAIKGLGIWVSVTLLGLLMGFGGWLTMVADGDLC